MLRYWSGLPLFLAIVISLFLSCVKCRAQSATAETSSPPVLLANTPVQLRLKKNLYKTDAKPGWPVEFEVAFDVIIDEQVVIPSGAAVNGSVRQFDLTGGGPAKLLIDLEPTQTITGEMVRLTGPGNDEGRRESWRQTKVKRCPRNGGVGPRDHTGFTGGCAGARGNGTFPREEGPPSQGHVGGRSCFRKCCT